MEKYTYQNPYFENNQIRTFYILPEVWAKEGIREGEGEVWVTERGREEGNKRVWGTGGEVLSVILPGLRVIKHGNQTNQSTNI